jgi:hypothetical protein
VKPVHYTEPSVSLTPREVGWACGGATPWSPPGTDRTENVTCRACKRTTAYAAALARLAIEVGIAAATAPTTQDGGDTDG